MRLEEAQYINDGNDSLLNYIEGWSYDILRIMRERDLPEGERDYWGLFDLVAAYHSRDKIELLACGKVPLTVVATDELLKTFGDELESSWLTKYGASPGSGWWWRWIPRIGPIAREVDRYSSGTEISD